jgi:hypothetical protein
VAEVIEGCCELDRHDLSPAPVRARDQVQHAQ